MLFSTITFLFFFLPAFLLLYFVSPRMSWRNVLLLAASLLLLHKGLPFPGWWALLPVIAMICGIIGLRPEGIAIILGVNTFLDMCRTSLNVTGDLATAVVVSHQAGEKEEEIAVLDEVVLEQAGLEKDVTDLESRGRPDRQP